MFPSTSPALGKRKRCVGAENPRKRTSTKIESLQPKDEQDINEIFRRAFESKFKPIKSRHAKDAVLQPATLVDIHEEDQDSDWSGIDDGNQTTVEIVEHDAPISTMIDAGQEKKSFMSSKPPSTGQITTVKPSKTKVDGEDDSTESTNLKHDLALQRLLTESHLLNDDIGSGPAGKNRLKAVDLRLKSLGAKTSLLEQKNMPMSHRKGINAKKAEKESLRRREAKENGIILERVTGADDKSSSSKSHNKHQALRGGVSGHSIGKFRSGTLSLSKKDVSSLTRPTSARGRKGGMVKGRGRVR